MCMMFVDDDAFWLNEADPAVDICDATLTVGACLDVIIPKMSGEVDLDKACIVEIGCGIGRLAAPVKAMFPGATVIGTDISARFLDIATRDAPGPTYCLTKNLTGLPLAETSGGHVDAIYSMAVLQHIRNNEKALHIYKASTALRMGGVFVFQYVEGSHESRCMYDAEIDDIEKCCLMAGFDVVEVEHDLLFPRWTWVTAVKR